MIVLSGLTGTAQWAAGASEPEEDAAPIKAGGEAVTPETVVDIPMSEGWSAIQKGLLFFVVIGAVAFYVRWTQRRDERDEVGYEKTMA